MAFQYNGDKCPKCRRYMIVAPPIPANSNDQVKCQVCGHQGTLDEFAEAYDRDFPEDE
ncbi:hypothetical protein HAP48_0042980 [Bradyrhizobium septentrionale]|uniref:Uncharacterized protein n=1 Tax=Bradyrhizobium septentrionale TaxID=1404411 RepID=A0A973W2Q2_9BRAD|nr:MULTISPECIES: hypothetical protein [Bradyrhizobium]MCK7671468.1 hypothetical protein [Bradyrhizobium sp. 2S1]UGY15223.1 hypothetical protein HAP48_0042980 [Bradyrhizobium septentrionale]